MRLTIGRKLTGGFLIVAVMLGVSGGVSVTYMNQMNDSYQSLIQKNLMIEMNLKDVQGLTNAQTGALMAYLMTGDDNALKSLQDANQQTSTLISQIIPKVANSSNKNQIIQLSNLNSEFKSKADQAVNLSSSDRQKAMNYFKTDIFSTSQNMQTLSQQLTAGEDKIVKQALQTTDDLAQRVKQINLVMAIIATILAVGIGYFVSRLISKPIKKMSDMANHVAEGDLTIEPLRLKNRDEIGDLATSFNKMVHNLNELIRQVGTSTEIVAASAEQLNASSQQTRQATEHIASTIEEVAVGSEMQVQNVQYAAQTITEMVEGIQRISGNANVVSTTAEQASQIAIEGSDSIERAVSQMNLIHEHVLASAQSIQELEELTNHIGLIIETITGIAEQTNLLALNAAIEAARAGEHGRGFAVVSDEVRKLAEQSAESGKKIAEYITTIRTGIQRAVASMEADTKNVSIGIEVVHTAGSSFEELHNAVGAVASQIQEVSASVQQIASGANQVVQSIDSITESTETTAAGTQSVSAVTEEQLASMEEISSSANSLAEMATELQGHISKFKI